MQLWIHWWNAIGQLRPACSRDRTFIWFATAVAGLTVRTERLGVTSIVRALGLQARFYYNLLELFHSTGANLDAMSTLWTQLVLRLFPEPVRVHGRLVLVGDGIKVGKCGKKMPAVKLLHQESESNTKPEYIMGHSLQAVSLLVCAAKSVFAVPLAIRIHEGLVWSNRDKRTLLDKMIALLGIVAIQQPFYFVADAYYASHKVINGLLRQNNHLVTRVKSNAVAYTVFDRQGAKSRG
jgi:DDE superfamily endonuclease